MIFLSFYSTFWGKPIYLRRYKQEPPFTSFKGDFHEEPALWVNAPILEKTLLVETSSILFER